MRKTRRAVVVDEGWRSGSLAAEVSARIMEQAFYDLDAPVGRVCSEEVPMPYPRHLEEAALPQAPKIVAAVKALLPGSDREQEAIMTPKLRKQILDLMKGHRSMTIATVRPDGYPQATTVTYANDGLDLYFSCDRNSQKVRNIGRNRKVSLAIDHDVEDWNEIQGLSLGGTAKVVKDPKAFRRALKLLAKKYPEMAKLSEEDMKDLAIVHVRPKVISVLDYTRGFGHTDLVRV